MPDLGGLIKRAQKGAAAESAMTLLTEKLNRMREQSESALESAKDDASLREAKAYWKAVRRLLREFRYDIADGQAAEKDL